MTNNYNDKFRLYYYIDFYYLHFKRGKYKLSCRNFQS